ncbi:hypothetical protein M885DRAFT_519415 [Pelagophyceae sp. CCMP2097]|nr:hypothetical protein M885DRAFT_519415 [Pelagophyceae sp. CCMP2097]|mmetsp:Transcript_12757/g.44073  ORF Transcript_12757/g.44073 Transcript_12757/m.44073 type:complete len:336 (+) Transcript_12757:35-1042(+)
MRLVSFTAPGWHSGRDAIGRPRGRIRRLATFPRRDSQGVQTSMILPSELSRSDALPALPFDAETSLPLRMRLSMSGSPSTMRARTWTAPLMPDAAVARQENAICFVVLPLTLALMYCCCMGESHFTPAPRLGSSRRSTVSVTRTMSLFDSAMALPTILSIPLNTDLINPPIIPVPSNALSSSRVTGSTGLGSKPRNFFTPAKKPGLSPPSPRSGESREPPKKPSSGASRWRSSFWSRSFSFRSRASSSPSGLSEFEKNPRSAAHMALVCAEWPERSAPVLVVVSENRNARRTPRGPSAIMAPRPNRTGCRAVVNAEQEASEPASCEGTATLPVRA